MEDWAEVYATAQLLDAEARFLQLGRTTDGPTMSAVVAARVSGWTPPGRGHPLSAAQVDAVTQEVTSGRQLGVLVGAAGTGKSTTMAAVRAAWEATHGLGSVVGLAPSSAAAEVLADAVGAPTENTATWLAEHGRTPELLRALQGYGVRLSRAYPSPQTGASLATPAAAGSAIASAR